MRNTSLMQSISIFYGMTFYCMEYIAAHIYLSVLLWNHLYSFTVRTVIIVYPWYLNHIKL